MKVSGGAAIALAVGLGIVALVPTRATGDDGQTVLVTRPGVVFHAVGSKDLRGHGYQKSVTDALAAGYVPCRICFAHAQVSRTSGPASGGGAAASFSGAAAAISPATSGSATSLATNGRSGFHHSPVEDHGVKDPYLLYTYVVRGQDQDSYTH
jgi:hypothetical protein